MKLPKNIIEGFFVFHFCFLILFFLPGTVKEKKIDYEFSSLTMTMLQTKQACDKVLGNSSSP